jgi:flavin reductase (DIM6/NTAB) family NADH-FMN oxidoreductase RutF
MPTPAIPRKASSPAFSQREFRASLAMFATGVTIVTARTPAGVLVGLTANSFNSVSLQPPLVLWSLAQAAGSMPALSTGSHYAINILAADQKDAGRALRQRARRPLARRGLYRRRQRRATAGRRGRPASSASTAAAMKKATM